MKRTLTILLLLLPLTLPAQQRIHAFVSSGVTIAQIEGDELKGFTQVGYIGGVGALSSISSNNRWGLSLEALYSQRGCYNNSSDPYNVSIHLNYIDIPLLLHYQDPYGGMLIGAGLCYGRLVQQPHGILKYNSEYFYPDTTDMTFLSNDLSVMADFRFTVWRGLQFNVRWQYSLMPIKREWSFYEKIHGRWENWENDCYNHSLAFRLIWQF